MNDAAFKTGTKKIKWQTFINAFTKACRDRSRTARKVEDYLIPTFDLDEARAHYSRGYNKPTSID